MKKLPGLVKDIIAFFARYAIAMVALWVVVTFMFGLAEWHAGSSTMLVIWAFLPLVVLAVDPLIVGTVGATTADKDTRTKVEGVSNPLIISWVIGLMYAVVARFGHWGGNGEAFLYHLVGYAIAAGLASKSFGNAKWTKTATTIALLMSLVTTIIGFNKDQVSWLAGKVNTNWIPTATTTREQSHRLKDYIKGLWYDQKMVNSERKATTAIENIDSKVAEKQAADIEAVSKIAVEKTIDLGFVPPPPAKVKQMQAGWLPMNMFPVRYRTSTGGDYPIQSLNPNKFTVSFVYYQPAWDDGNEKHEGQNVTISWARESYQAEVRYERDGSAMYEIHYDPYIKAMVGSKTIDGKVVQFFVECAEFKVK